MKIYYIFAILVAVLALWGILARLYVSQLEQPKYSVLSKHQGYEIREYKPYIVAEVTIPDNDQALNRGFSLVAQYIFGGNTGSQSIAMTSPVLDSPQGQNIAMTSPVLDSPQAGSRTVAFVLPSEYTLENLPTPLNDQVKIRTVPAQKRAVKSYIALRREPGKKKAETSLRKALARDQQTVISEATFAFYDPPLTPFFARKNEVLIDLK